MRKIFAYALFLNACCCFSQQSDFKNIDFSKADQIAKSIKSRKLLDLNKLTFQLTNDLETDLEKLRSIYVWICTNIANDFRLYRLNEKKRKKFLNDSIQLAQWNSQFKKKLFKKLLHKKKTICTGYAYLLKEMCAIVGIPAKMVNGFGKTATVDFSELPMPNHTWNVVQINSKWYLCDPTWSTGISFPEDGTFKFDYNNGYFLANPSLFNLNHFPLEKEFHLTEQSEYDFNAFAESPIIYGDAFQYLTEHISPKKMHHSLLKNDTLSFEYELSKSIDLRKVKFILFNGSSERTIKPIKHYQENTLKLKSVFKTRGYFDLHLYIEEKLISTYTVEVKKRKKATI